MLELDPSFILSKLFRNNKRRVDVFILIIPSRLVVCAVNSACHKDNNKRAPDDGLLFYYLFFLV